MGAANAMNYFKRGVLLITPGDREDIILTACATLESNPDQRMAGIVLTGNLRPNASLMKVIQGLPIPVLFTLEDSYRVASKVHDLTVKTRPGDADKISLIRDLVTKKVDLEKILAAVGK
jgi:BioD-like phosphotransacetylase family protein